MIIFVLVLILLAICFPDLVRVLLGGAFLLAVIGGAIGLIIAVTVALAA